MISTDSNLKGAGPVKNCPVRQLVTVSALISVVACLGMADAAGQESTARTIADGSILPFPPTPSASVAGPTLQESTMKWRKEPARLRPGAPNVLIVLIDDVGFGVPDTFGGEVHTPTLTPDARLRGSATMPSTRHRSARRPAPHCLTGQESPPGRQRHDRRAGFRLRRLYRDHSQNLGHDRRDAASLWLQVGGVFGKWHNTPANQTTAMGPFDRWPTGHGFDYFYGFLAGETSQWEPRLYENLNAIEPPHSEKYHLTEDMVDKGLAWIRRHQAFSPDKPFFMYWAPGARMARTTSSPNGLINTKVSSTTAGTGTASGSSPGRSNLAGFPPTRN